MPSKAKKKQSAKPPTQYKLHQYWNRSPLTWSIISFIEERQAYLNKEKLFNEYRKSLEFIIGGGAGLDLLQVTRAKDLLQQFTMKGESDSWVGSRHYDKLVNSTPLNNYGTVINGSITDSVFNNRVSVHGTRSSRNSCCDTASTVSEGDNPALADRTLIPDNTDKPDRTLRDRMQVVYNAMRDDDKWHLGSGRCVEDIFYERCQQMDDKRFEGTLARSFILDTSNQMIQGWFRPNEWEQIHQTVLPLPSPDQKLFDILNTIINVRTVRSFSTLLVPEWISGYQDKNLNDVKVKDVKDKDVKDNGDNDDVHDDFFITCQWANLVLTNFLFLLTIPNSPFAHSHHEGWYQSMLWSMIVDRCFISIPGLTIERTETTSQAGAARKNRDRKEAAERELIGPRHDAIIRTLQDGALELGAVEDSSSFRGGETSTKWLDDNFKLIRSMHDMLYRIHKSVDYNQKAIRNVQTFGFVTAGLTLQFLRLGYPGCGHVSLLCREKPMNLPTTIKQLPSLLAMIVLFTSFRKVAMASLNAIEDYLIGQDLATTCKIVDGSGAGSVGGLYYSGDSQ